jgi:hypothetical protein
LQKQQTKRTLHCNTVACGAHLTPYIVLQVLLNDVTLRDSVSAVGAAIAIQANTTLEAVDCVLSNNSATVAGALSLIHNSRSHLTGLTLFNNSAQQEAGGMWAADNAQVRPLALAVCFCCCPLQKMRT